MRKFYFISAVCLFIGCSRDNDSFQLQSFVNHYNSDYMMDVSKIGYDPGLEVSNYINTLENDGRNYTKRKFSKYSVSNPSMIYADRKYDEIITNKNEIKITRCFLNEDGSVAFKSNFPTLFKVNNGKIVEKILGERILKFEYEGNKITTITETDIHIEGVVSKTRIYYNNKGNVDSLVKKRGTVNITQEKTFFTYDDKIKNRVKIILSDYDTAKNPFKSLIIFDDVFLRALSNNNFRHYQEISYDKENKIRSILERKWKFRYTDGEWMY